MKMEPVLHMKREQSEAKKKSILPILIEEMEKLPPCAKLPSQREIKKRFYVGSSAASEIAASLREHFGAERKRCARSRKTGAGRGNIPENELRAVTTISIGRVWLPIIDEYNRTHVSKITLKFVNDACNILLYFQKGTADLYLLPHNPVALGIPDVSAGFAPVDDVFSSLNPAEFYDCVPFCTKDGVCRGIRPFLSPEYICFHKELCRFPVRQYDWDEFEDLLVNVRRRHPYPALRFPCFLSPLECCWHRGVRLIDPATGRFQPDENAFVEAMFRHYSLCERGLAVRYEDLPEVDSKARIFPFLHREIAISSVQHIELAMVESAKPEIMPMPCSGPAPLSPEGEFIGMDASSSKKEEVRDFAAFVLSRNIQEQLLLRVMVFPARRGIQPYFMNRTTYRTFLQNIEKSISVPEQSAFVHEIQARVHPLVRQFVSRGGDPRIILNMLRTEYEERIRSGRWSAACCDLRACPPRSRNRRKQ